MADRPHFAFPFERDPSGKIRVVEQDSDEHVMSCEHVIVRCPLGWREDKPEFGWPWPEFANMPLDLTGLEAALRRWEPRSRANATDYTEVANAAVREVTVEVEL